VAAISLGVASGYTRLFQNYIVRNLQYWQGYLTTHGLNHDYLDQERERIISAINYGLDSAENWPTTYLLITKLAPYMERRGYWDTWNKVLNEALQVAQRRQEPTAEIDLLALLARLLYRQSRFKESVAAYRRVIRLARRLGREYDQARACTNLGYYYVEQGYWYRAEALCCHALKIFEQIDSAHGRAHTHNHLGVLYTRQEKWNKAQQHLKRACKIWQTMGDVHGLMRGYGNLGYLLNKIDQPDEAMFYLKKGLDHAKQVGEEIIIGTIYQNLGESFKLKGELSQAELYYRQAEITFQQFSSLIDLASLREDLGLMYVDWQQWEKAGVYLEAALAGWKTIGNKYRGIQTIFYLAYFEKLRGNEAGSRAWLKEMQIYLNDMIASNSITIYFGKPERSSMAYLSLQLTKLHQVKLVLSQQPKS
jgi:tetratricopeptide (TPR) repeat protein